jgi:hypothetical protein
VCDEEVIERLCGDGEVTSGATCFLSGDILRTGELQSIRLENVDVTTACGPDDDPDVRRLNIVWQDGHIELLPTKGLSIGRYNHGNWHPFWEPVVPGILSPERENLLGEVLVHGQPVQGLRWIENFSGCIELLGLSNWGMPRLDPPSGRVVPLHGEAARIPVEGVTVTAGGRFTVVAASFNVNSQWWREVDDGRPWYQRGRPDWRITRTVVVDCLQPRLQFVDTLTNISEHKQVPEWGYHVQLRAAPGARLHIPSKRVAVRGSTETPPPDYQTWHPAVDPGQRVERGYVHKGLYGEPGPFDTPVITGRAIYRDGPDTLFTLPIAAYTLSWFSCGGRGSLEFAFPETPGTSRLPTGWDGMGPEFGTSALDHDGDTDPGITHKHIEPGEATRLYFFLERSGTSL